MAFDSYEGEWSKAGSRGLELPVIWTMGSREIYKIDDTLAVIYMMVDTECMDEKSGCYCRYQEAY